MTNFEDRRTKAQILEQLFEAQTTITDLERKIPNAPRQVPEAEALARCIRALDDFLSQSRNSSNSYSYPRNENGSAVERILRSLAGKYSINLVQVEHRDCDRRHIDEANEQELVWALRNAGQGV